MGASVCLSILPYCRECACLVQKVKMAVDQDVSRECRIKLPTRCLDFAMRRLSPSLARTRSHSATKRMGYCDGVTLGSGAGAPKEPG